MKNLFRTLVICAAIVFGVYLRVENPQEPSPLLPSAAKPALVAPHPQPPASEAVPAVLVSTSVNHATNQQPAWAIPYGREFWRQSSLISGGTVNAAEVMERCSHAFDKRGTGTIEAAGQTFSVSISESGLCFRVLDPSNKPEAELSLRTESVRFGPTLHRIARTGYSVTGNTAQSPIAPNLIEHVETRENGASLTWILKDRMNSDLEISLSATGMGYAGETGHGLHFKNSQGIARARISHVTVVDSAGTRTQLPLQFAQNKIVARVSGALLASARYPVAIDPTISAEFEMDQPVQSPAYGWQSRSRVAAKGSDWLIVWKDTRGGSRIRGAVMDGNTNQLKTPGAGIVIAEAYTGLDLEVAANDADWLVAWTNGTGAESQLYATVVNGSTYALKTPDSISLCTVAGSKTLVGVEAAGTDWLVVWSDARTSVADLYGAIVEGSTSLAVTAENGFSICSATGVQDSISLAPLGTKWLVGWKDMRSGTADIYGAVVDGATRSVTTPADGFVICDAMYTQEEPHVSSNGSDWLAVWADRRLSSGAPDIYCAVISGEDSTFKTVDDGIPITSSFPSDEAPRAAAVGSDWLIIWVRSGGIYGSVLNGQTLETETAGNGFWLNLREDGSADTQICSNGTDWLVATVYTGLRASIVDGASNTLKPNATGIFLCNTSESQYAFRVASNQTDWLIAWEDYRARYPDIYGAVMSGATGNVETAANGVLLCKTDNGQRVPKAAAVGADWLVVWEDHRNPLGADIYGAVVNGSSGAMETSASGFAICSAEKDQTSCEIAANGHDWLVVWVDDRTSLQSRIYGAVVNGSSNQIETQSNGFVMPPASGDQTLPQVVSNGEDWLVAWVNSSNIRATVINGSSNASELTNSLAICSSSGTQTSPQVAATASYWLVVWEDYRGGSLCEVYGAAIDRTSNAIKTVANGFRISPGYYQNDHPRIAGKGTEALVVWSQSQNGNYYNILGGFIRESAINSASGPQNLASLITDAPYNQRYPQVASNGSKWLVVWQDYRSGTTWDIYGLITDGTIFPIAEGAGQQHSPLVAGASGHWMVAWVTGDDHLEGAFVGGDGARTSPFGISGASSYYPAIVANSQGKALALSSPPRQEDVMRIAGRLIDPYASLSFPPIGTREFSNQLLPLTATSSTGAPIAFRVVSGPGYISSGSNQLSMRGVGTITVSASQAGTAGFLPSTVTQSFRVVDETRPKIRAKQRIELGRYENRAKLEVLCTDNYFTEFVRVRIKAPGQNGFGRVKKYEYKPRWGKDGKPSFPIQVAAKREGVYKIELIAEDAFKNKSRPLIVQVIK